MATPQSTASRLDIMSKMFGLMRIRSCGVARPLRGRCRLHYCGVCKTIGQEYGQAARLFLNHDTVLVAELMSALSRNDAPRPEFLRYAAAANVLLASVKAADHAADSGRLLWRWLAGWLRPRHLRARSFLRSAGVPVEAAEQLLDSQRERESRPDSLEQLAEPTAFATAAILGQAAVVAGTPDQKPFLERFGRRFGTFIYLLDAWEDFARDRRRGEFNAFHAIYGGREPGRPILLHLAGQLQRDFELLPVDAAFGDVLGRRFRLSLYSRYAGLFPLAVEPERHSRWSDFQDWWEDKLCNGCGEKPKLCGDFCAQCGCDCGAECCLRACCHNCSYCDC